MIDIRSYFCSLKASWVNRLVNGKDANWKLIPMKYYGGFGTNWLIFRTNNDDIKLHECFKNIPEFYADIVQCWKKTGIDKVKEPVTFTEIRKQIIWNNKFILFKNKTLVFENWIKSGIIFINDILDDKGCFSQRIILDKLKNKSNWISEINILKKSIPGKWYDILRTENSIKTTVNVVRSEFKWKNSVVDISSLSNRILYKSLIDKKFESSVGFNKWLQILEISHIYGKENLYFFIFKYLQENKLRIFRRKLLQYILPTHYVSVFG